MEELEEGDGRVVDEKEKKKGEAGDIVEETSESFFWTLHFFVSSGG